MNDKQLAISTKLESYRLMLIADLMGDREMKDFRTLTVWQRAHELTLAVYRSTKTFPKPEQFALTNQIQRAAVSIPANIAEGCGSGSDGELKRYLQIGMASSNELEYLLLLARDLEYLDPGQYESLANLNIETQKMLNAFIRKLRT